MCGIIAHVGDGSARDPLVTGLESLGYRGYDSADVAVGPQRHRRMTASSNSDL
ncbi:glutamine--fructose-6-phosphate transaminase (isomerizing) [Haloferax mucosum ATCC BAA-1512]|uniref:Glutamine--fructose-6-phosphate transaminase (Isomerizing) n=1 Tax=Haloferax mucosum ATCC BAA-1512 TaxID=662479 RepID=M0IQK5_9EURY|nr:glutamine--fructose-6-phosphate aminotransferase (isomerizing) [Haloferax mucosum]ELZ98103.1 glutamine--fructose-6-phosphate transaminase (isomerizing) [Haloferax mucosum ATCC BAA-1512]